MVATTFSFSVSLCFSFSFSHSFSALGISCLLIDIVSWRLMVFCYIRQENKQSGDRITVISCWDLCSSIMGSVFDKCIGKGKSVVAVDARANFASNHVVDLLAGTACTRKSEHAINLPIYPPGCHLDAFIVRR